MINQNLINNLPPKSGFLYNHILNPFETTNYKIKKGLISGCWEVYEKGNLNMLFNDSSIIINDYAKNIKNLNFSSILFGGLGFGILPYLCQDYVNTVDIVEIDNEIINIVNEIGHLNSKVKIINANFLNFTTENKYDIIVVDIWNNSTVPNIKQQIRSVSEKFTNNLNENGLIYIPIIEWTRIEI